MKKVSGKRKRGKSKLLRFKLSDLRGKFAHLSAFAETNLNLDKCKNFLLGRISAQPKQTGRTSFNQTKKGKRLSHFSYGQDNFLIYLAGSFLIFVLFFVLSFKVNHNSRPISAISPTDYKIMTAVGLKGKQTPLEDKVFVYKPVLKNGVFSFPVVSAESVVVFDLTSRTSLYEKDPTLSLLPASVTKLVTALVVIDSFPSDQILTFNGRRVDGQKIGLKAGEKLKMIDALGALLIYSANDVAYLFADNFPGGEAAFVEAMNRKVADLGLTGTHFENPTGFDGGGHYTTARDLVKISEMALANEDITRLARTKEIDIESADGQEHYHLTSTNKLLGEVPGVLGLKTGWTENARENLVTYYDKDGHRLLIVLLGSQDRFGETKEILDWVLNSYDWLWVEAK